LWRIAIRLRIILSAGWIKRALAIHSINACLDSERQRMQDARDNIMVSSGQLISDLHSDDE